MKIHMKKIIVFYVIILIAIILNTVPTFAASNLILNSSFEDVSGTMPSNWSVDAWKCTLGAFDIKVETGSAHSGDKFVTITNNIINDIRLKQTINVEKNSIYKLSCWIKTENAAIGKNETGANISIEGNGKHQLQ